MTVRAKATILETDGKRVLFAVEAWDEVEKVAEGRHERVVVGNLERFLERAMAKGKSVAEEIPMPLSINTSIKGKEYAPYVVHVERARSRSSPAPSATSPLLPRRRGGARLAVGDIIALPPSPSPSATSEPTPVLS